MCTSSDSLFYLGQIPTEDDHVAFLPSLKTNNLLSLAAESAAEITDFLGLAEVDGLSNPAPHWLSVFLGSLA